MLNTIEKGEAEEADKRGDLVKSVGWEEGFCGRIQSGYKPILLFQFLFYYYYYIQNLMQLVTRKFHTASEQK